MQVIFHRTETDLSMHVTLVKLKKIREQIYTTNFTNLPFVNRSSKSCIACMDNGLLEGIVQAVDIQRQA